MKKLLIASLVLLASGVGAQQPPAPPQTAPDIPFDVQDVIKMPPDLYLGEAAGVALNSKRHIFIYTLSFLNEITGAGYLASFPPYASPSSSSLVKARCPKAREMQTASHQR